MPDTTGPFDLLPALAQHILTHEVNTDINLALVDQYQLTPEQQAAMLDINVRVFNRDMPLNGLQLAIQNELKLDPGAAKKITIDLLGKRYLPLEFYLGPIQPLIKDLGGNPATYLAEAKKNWPEAYGLPETPAGDEEPERTEIPTTAWSILEEFEERMAMPRGKEEILLRLTGVAAAVDKRVQAGTLTAAEGEKITGQLDQLSFIINTHDLNQFEVQSIKRRLTRLLPRAMSA